jgi:rhamnosyltransferase subunit B
MMPVARILIANFGSYGDLYPYVGLAIALRNIGHRPLLATAEFYRPLIESLGFDFRPIGPAIDPDDLTTIARVMDPVKGPDELIRGFLLPALRSNYAVLEKAAREADLIVTHPITFAAPIVAQVVRLPWVSTVLAPMSFFSASDAPVLAPAPYLVRLAALGPWYGRVLARFARTSTRTWMQPVFDLRRDLGLPAGEHPLFEGQFSPTRTLALYSRVLGAPQPDWPPHVSVTGFVFYNGPEALAPELEAFLDAGPPPIVFTLGTSAVGVAGGFYEESIGAAQRLGRRAVLLTGGIERNQPRGRVPQDVMVVDRAPHQLLFPRAAAIVHHGGAGTLAQALRSGRPMIVVPHAHDQADNAFRVARLGVARTVRPKAYRRARVAHALERLLLDANVLARASDEAAIVRSEGGADGAAAAIDAVLT